MCGIAGILDIEGSRAPEELRDQALRMAETLRHRGPDQRSAWSADGAPVGLGHARLSVIDLATGDQPMSTPDGELTVVFNGEIYNFPELRDQLMDRGHVFRTRSDTEVLLFAWREWGEAMLSRLEGMFAFALWDRGRERLFLARDRAGKKPLFIWRGQGRLAFASEIKAFRALPDVRLEVDPDAIPLYLAYGYVPTPNTPCAGVTRVPPATALSINKAGWIESRRYWEPDLRPRAVSTTAAERRVRELLDEAVRRRLISDVPLGAFLSGGVDSSAIVARMARFSSGPVRTFAIGFEGAPIYDETAWARQAAELIGTEHTEFRVGAQSVDLVDRLVAAYDEPFGDSSAIPTYMVSGLARESVTVALTGDGGDELFAGYDRFIGAQVAEGIPRALVAIGNAVGSRLPVHSNFRHPTRRFARFFKAASLPAPERTLRWIGFFADRLEDILLPQTRERLDPARLMESFRAPLRGERAGHTALSQALKLNYETYLPEDLLVKSDRCSMAHGLELRSPFLDTALVEYAMSLPDGLKIHSGRKKAILKGALRAELPDQLLNRPKMGFGIPLPQWFRGEWAPLLEERVLDPQAALWRWIRREPVVRMVQEHMSGRADFGHQLWALLTLQVWLEQMDSAGLAQTAGGSHASI